MDAIAVHPDVAAWLETAGMLTYTNVVDTTNAASSIWGSGGIGLSSTQVALFAGLRVVVDEQLPVICNDGGPAQYSLLSVRQRRGAHRSAVPAEHRDRAQHRFAAGRVCCDLFSNLMHVDGYQLDKCQLRRSYQRATARSVELEFGILR